jgi:4-hydroxy-4-methyl-2-oxoglutarate aldolase
VSISARLGTLYTAAIADVLDGLGLPAQVLPHELRPLREGMRLAGPAFTVSGRTSPAIDYDASLRRILEALEAVPAGSVAVYATGDRIAAQFGELSATALEVRGAAGVVLDGGCRDVDFIRDGSLPVFARYLTPLDSVPRWQVVEWGGEVAIGDVRISTGDYVAGDADGVVVVPAAVAEEVVERAEAVVGTENLVREAVRAGTPPLEAYERYGKF